MGLVEPGSCHANNSHFSLGYLHGIFRGILLILLFTNPSKACHFVNKPSEQRALTLGPVFDKLSPESSIVPMRLKVLSITNISLLTR